MKNKIQISLIVLAVFFWCIWTVNASYSITGDELKQVNANKIVISNSSNYGLWDYYSQFAKWYQILKWDERLWTISKELMDYSYSLFSSRKQLLKQQSAWEKSKFLDEYKNNISIDVEFPADRCMWWYNTIDNISFANDFPTALTIAVWYRESFCAYYLPWNWDWPFQIVSKDYWTWEITEEIFKKTIQDFIDFSKRKIDNYNNRANDEYKKINLTYSWFDYTGVVNFAALYNGWTRTGGMVVPNAPEYVFDGYGKDYNKSKKYGIYSMFLKVLDWELKNSK